MASVPEAQAVQTVWAWPDGVGARSAGGADRVGLARDAEGDRNVCARFVRNQLGHGERGNSALAAVHVLRVGRIDNVHAAKACACDNARGILGEVFGRKASVCDSFLGGCEQELREAGHAAGFLRVDSVFFGLEILDFGSNLYRATACVKKGDRANTALAFANGCPKIVNVLANGSHGSHTSDYYASFSHAHKDRKTSFYAG